MKSAGTGQRSCAPAGTSWGQVNLILAPAADPERVVLGQLDRVLRAAESAGLLASWFFMRKQRWRVRYLPASKDTASHARHLLLTAASRLRRTGRVLGWTETIYEPETYAFGGRPAITAAHQLFHHDSRHIANYLQPTSLGEAGIPASSDKRREISYLLCTALLRAARQDYFEQGDIWGKVADLRSAFVARHGDCGLRPGITLTPAALRLITVDTRPGTPLRDTAVLPFDTEWLTGFEQAGGALRDLAAEGNLTRGIRAVLAHHVIFHWNRIGLPPASQAVMATAARDAIFGTPPGGAADSSVRDIT